MKHLVYFPFAFLLLLGCQNKNTELDSDTTNTNEGRLTKEILLDTLTINKALSYHLVGTLGTGINIVMELLIEKMKISGFYYYTKVGKTISLEGQIAGDGSLEINEYPEPETTTGTFLGTFKEGVFAGTWENDERSKKLSFSLSEDYTKAVQFELFTGEITYNLSHAVKSPSCHVKVRYLYPIKYQDSTLLDAFRQASNKFFTGDLLASYDKPQELIRQYISEYLKGYVELEKDFDSTKRANSEMFMWDEEHLMEVKYNDNNILSMNKSHYQFTGGAHGNGNFYFSVVDLTSGKTLQISDIFIDSYEERITPVIKEKIKEYHGMSSDVELADFVSSMEALGPNKNFFMDNKGIGFFFNPYEIAEYTGGVSQAYIPFNEIRDLLKKDSPVARLWK